MIYHSHKSNLFYCLFVKDRQSFIPTNLIRFMAWICLPSTFKEAVITAWLPTPNGGKCATWTLSSTGANHAARFTANHEKHLQVIAIFRFFFFFFFF